MNKKLYWIPLLAILLLSTACESSPSTSSTNITPTPAPTLNRNLKLEDARIREVIPTADGGAYVRAYGESQISQLWYVRGGVAVKVRESETADLFDRPQPNATNKLFALWIQEQQKRKSLEDEKDELESEVTSLEEKLNQE